MLFNPFRYQFEAQYLSDEGTSALLRIRKGTVEEDFHFPKTLIPPELQIGDHFVLNLQASETAKQNESAVLKTLLEELIH